LRSARRSIGERAFSVHDSDERLGWLIVLATIPVGLTGLLLEHTFRTLLAKPLAASIFLFANGLILLAGERARRRIEARGAPAATLAGAPVGTADSGEAGGERASLRAPHRGARSVDELAEAYASDVRIAGISYLKGLYIGSCQILALFAGISRSGVTIVGGLFGGLDHEDAARFAFLLATPVILAAGVLKLPSLTGHAGEHIHGQVVVGMVFCGVAAYISVRFLVRYFRTRTLTPFAIYCLIVGFASVVRFA
jgi:undecaprenyl-diphosphatase